MVAKLTKGQRSSQYQAILCWKEM